MGSRFQFEIMTEEHARNLLSWKINQAEFFGDKIRAQRRLLPVASAQELENNKAYLEGREARGKDGPAFPFPPKGVVEISQ